MLLANVQVGTCIVLIWQIKELNHGNLGYFAKVIQLTSVRVTSIFTLSQNNSTTYILNVNLPSYSNKYFPNVLYIDFAIINRVEILEKRILILRI